MIPTSKLIRKFFFLQHFDRTWRPPLHGGGQRETVQTRSITWLLPHNMASEDLIIRLADKHLEPILHVEDSHNTGANTAKIRTRPRSHRRICWAGARATALIGLQLAHRGHSALLGQVLRAILRMNHPRSLRHSEVGRSCRCCLVASGVRVHAPAGAERPAVSIQAGALTSL
jgi:hypothetical protein